MDEVDRSAFERQVSNVLGFGVARASGASGATSSTTSARSTPTAAINRVVQNVGNGERTYKGIEFTLDKRFSNNWSASGSYTYSQTRGNHFGDDFTDARRLRGRDLPADGGPGPGRCERHVPVPQTSRRTCRASPTFDRPHLIKFIGSYRQPIGPVDLTAGVVGTGAVEDDVLEDAHGERARAGHAHVQATTLTYNYDGLGSDRIDGHAVHDGPRDRGDLPRGATHRTSA